MYKHYIKCTCSVKDRSQKAHSICIYLLGQRGLCGMCVLVQAQLDTLHRKRGHIVKEYLDISAVSVEIYLGWKAGEVVDEGRSQFSLFLCSSHLWGRKGMKGLLLLL